MSRRSCYTLLLAKAKTDKISANREQILGEAWIGDAILALYVRQRILRESGQVDGPLASRMSSNQFLSTFGDASGVEARIGRLFVEHGLEAALRWIESELMPRFEKQERNRVKRGL